MTKNNLMKIWLFTYLYLIIHEGSLCFVQELFQILVQELEY